MKPKKKINLTIDDDILASAKRFVAETDQSLSAVVESFLRDLVTQTTKTDQDWLADFHARYLVEGYREPNDKELDEQRKDINRKYQ